MKSTWREQVSPEFLAQAQVRLNRLQGIVYAKRRAKAVNWINLKIIAGRPERT